MITAGFKVSDHANSYLLIKSHVRIGCVVVLNLEGTVTLCIRIFLGQEANENGVAFSSRNICETARARQIGY